MRRLETTVDLLNALQERYGWTSDRQIGAGLGIPQQTISSWRVGRTFPTEVHAIRLAQALEIPPAMVLVISAADRTSDADARAQWKKIVREIGRTGVGVLAALLVGAGSVKVVDAEVPAPGRIMAGYGKRRRGLRAVA